MVSFALPVARRPSLAFHIALNMALFYLGNAMPDIPVHVTVARPKGGDNSLPDQLSLAIQDDSGWLTDLVLTRAKYIEPNIPVYTYCGGHQGGSDYQLADLEDSQNVAYYQSEDHTAAMQVTQVESSENHVDFLLNGELLVNGTRCSLTIDHEAKGRAAFSGDQIYIIHELPALVGKIDEVIGAQPWDAEVFHTSDPGTPSGFSSGGRLSETLFSSDTEYAASDVYVDVVAVVDYALYSQFEEKFKSSAIPKIKEHYTSTFNGIDALYQRTSGLQHSIHIRLVKIYVDQTSSQTWWSTEQFLTGYYNQIDGEWALNTLTENAATYKNPFVPYDHLMFFTGYDMVTVGSGHNQLIGIAREYVCQINSVTVIEDIGNFNLVKIAAHELGHALSAGHDGVDNNCDASANILGAYMESHQSEFSSCSASYFNNFIKGGLQSQWGQNCLLKKLPTRTRRSGLTRDLQDQKLFLGDTSEEKSVYIF